MLKLNTTIELISFFVSSQICSLLYRSGHSLPSAFWSVPLGLSLSSAFCLPFDGSDIFLIHLSCHQYLQLHKMVRYPSSRSAACNNSLTVTRGASILKINCVSNSRHRLHPHQPQLQVREINRKVESKASSISSVLASRTSAGD